MADSDHVTVVVTLTQRDYAAAVKALAGGSARRVLVWFSVLVLGWMGYSVLRTRDKPILNEVLLALALVLFLVLFVYLLPSLSARSFVKKNRDKLGPAKHSIGPEGTSYESPHGAGRANWSAYQRIRETRITSFSISSPISRRSCRSAALKILATWKAIAKFSKPTAKASLNCVECSSGANPTAAWGR